MRSSLTDASASYAAEVARLLWPEPGRPVHHPQPPAASASERPTSSPAPAAAAAGPDRRNRGGDHAPAARQRQGRARRPDAPARAVRPSRAFALRAGRSCASRAATPGRTRSRATSPSPRDRGTGRRGARPRRVNQKPVLQVFGLDGTCSATPRWAQRPDRRAGAPRGPLTPVGDRDPARSWSRGCCTTDSGPASRCSSCRAHHRPGSRCSRPPPGRDAGGHRARRHDQPPWRTAGSGPGCETGPPGSPPSRRAPTLASPSRPSRPPRAATLQLGGWHGDWGPGTWASATASSRSGTGSASTPRCRSGSTGSTSPPRPSARAREEASASRRLPPLGPAHAAALGSRPAGTS